MNKRVYLAMNIYPHEKDVDGIIKFLKSIANIGLNALIISDIGMCKLATTYTDIPIHASTQASILNEQTAKLWQRIGAKRIVLAREASLTESGKIKQRTGLETEVFIHGRCAVVFLVNAPFQMLRLAETPIAVAAYNHADTHTHCRMAKINTS